MPVAVGEMLSVPVFTASITLEGGRRRRQWRGDKARHAQLDR